MRFDLSNQVALVTGASSGLGFAISEALAEFGAKVVMTSSNQNRVDAAAELMKHNYGDESAVSLQMDVGNRKGVREQVQQVARTHGRIDILVACAGISAGPGYRSQEGQLTGVDDATWDKVLDVNLTGVFAAISAVAPFMMDRQCGRILVVSSIAGMRSEQMVGYAYAATKAAVNNLVRHAAMELAGHNILVNAIAPGPFATNIASGRLKDQQFAAEVASTIPLGRIAEPEEIKELALLLCSGASSFITGQVYAIDGGLTAR